MTYRENRGEEKRENEAEKKENRKREGGKLKMEEEKLQNEEVFFFFFFFDFSLFKTSEICFGSTKMGIFYREKYFTPGKK